MLVVQGTTALNKHSLNTNTLVMLEKPKLREATNQQLPIAIQHAQQERIVEKVQMLQTHLFVIQQTMFVQQV